LLGSGYEVDEAPSAEKALALLKRPGFQVDLVFSDVILPGMNGVAMAQKLRESRPDVRVLLTSGYAEDRAHWDVISTHGFRFLKKPYSLSDLVETVHDMLVGRSGRDAAG
jgi:two-component system cell cycle sensor histidine kinase/response regulator CckA